VCDSKPSRLYYVYSLGKKVSIHHVNIFKSTKAALGAIGSCDEIIKWQFKVMSRLKSHCQVAETKVIVNLYSLKKADVDVRNLQVQHH
jgi:hypothetical protein